MKAKRGGQGASGKWAEWREGAVHQGTGGRKGGFLGEIYPAPLPAPPQPVPPPQSRDRGIVSLEASASSSRPGRG